ncbi:MAG TPA: FtsX-like permease family protein [Thermoanaerobaculia bacterium]
MKFFPYVFKSLFRKKTRSLLTLGSILLPLFVVCLFGTLIRTLDRPATGTGMNRIVVRHKVSLSNWIPESYRGRIQQLGGIEEMSVWCWFGGKYVDYTPKNFFARFGVEPEKLLRVFDEARVVEGSARDWFADRSGAMVGTELVRRHGWKLGQKVVLQGDIYPVNLELTIRAIFDAPAGSNAALFFNWAYVEEALPRVKGRIGTFYVRARDADAVGRLPKQIDEMFDNTDAPTKTETEKEFQNGFVQMLGNVKFMLNGISSAIVFVILLIAANTMAMAARERVGEIAVLRTLGYQKDTILALILAESLLLALLGGLLGLGLFALGFGGFKAALMNTPMAGFAAGMTVYPSVLAVGFGISVFIGLFAGIVPAAGAVRRSITDGLRRVG